MFKTDQVLVGLNRMIHLARLEVFEGLTEQQSEELANLNFTLGDAPSAQLFEQHPEFYGMGNVKKEEEATSVNICEIHQLIDGRRMSSHRQADYRVIEEASTIIRKTNAPEITQIEADAAMIRLSQSFAASSIHPFLSSIGSYYTVYPLPTHIPQQDELKKWAEHFYANPSIERFNSLHKTLDEACVLGTEFVPFYENNFSALHDKICGVLWSINSATLLIHIAAGLCSKGFLDALLDELESERESLTDLNKYQKDIYNDVVKMSEKHCNENVVDLRCVLLLNILDAFMETTNEK